MSLVEDHSAGDTRSNRCWLKSSGQRVTHREEVEDEERKPRRGDRHCPSPPSPHTPSLSVCHWCVPGSLEHVEQSPRTLQPLMGGSSVSTSSKRPGSGSSASSFPLGGFPPSSRWSSRPRRTSLTSHSTFSSLTTAAMVRLISSTKKASAEEDLVKKPRGAFDSECRCAAGNDCCSPRWLAASCLQISQMPSAVSTCRLIT
jgi:hypothetical protein